MEARSIEVQSIFLWENGGELDVVCELREPLDLPSFNIPDMAEQNAGKESGLMASKI